MIWLETDKRKLKGEKMKRTFKHLSRADRIRIEALLKAGTKVKEIAAILRVHRSTIYREIKRGKFTALNSDLTKEERYSPDIAQGKYEENLKNKGGNLKIGNDIKLANYIEKTILKKNYSPAAALGEIKAKGQESAFSVMICVATLYSYIDKGIFLHLTNKDLPVKKNRKRKYKRVKKTQTRAAAGDSIEKRPEEIKTRNEFGHWEMDTVKGKRGKSKNSLLVLTERKTRKEIIMKLPEHTAAAVVHAIDEIEKKLGRNFKQVFKTITMDNGNEFSDCEGIERSSIYEGNRTKTYYCHPYSSYERGSNEVANKMIRRHIPKGASFDEKTDKEIQKIEDWINNYPRRIHDYKTSEELFRSEMKSII